MPEIVSKVIDCYVFRRREGRVEFLTLRRAARTRIGGTWQAVHGKIESGESAVGAALREMREETGLTPIGFWQLETVNTFYVAATDQIMLCPAFAAEVVADAAVAISDEHDEFRWCEPADAIAAFLWPGQRDAVRETMELIVGRSAAERFLRIDLG